MAKEKTQDRKYILEFTQKQMRVTNAALEEYFRLRMGQDFDFTHDMAAINADLSPENPEHDKIFDMYIARRDHLHGIMKAVFHVAFEPTGHLDHKTDNMLIAECIWDAMRVAMGTSRWDFALQTGSEPCPKIEVIESHGQLDDSREAIKRIREFGLHHAIKDLPHSTRTVEAFEAAVSALQRLEPRKPVWKEIEITNDGIPDKNAFCPVCGAEYEPDDIDRIGFDYCYGCGQRLDWD